MYPTREEYLAHAGIKGMKAGERHGPPYPISAAMRAAMAAKSKYQEIRDKVKADYAEKSAKKKAEKARIEQLSAKRKAASEKAKAEEAKVKAEEQKQKEELKLQKKKESYTKDPMLLYKHRDLFTKQELEEAINRFGTESRLLDTANANSKSEYNRKQLEQMVNWAKTVGNVYNTGAAIYNVANPRVRSGQSGKLPFIDLNARQENTSEKINRLIKQETYRKQKRENDKAEYDDYYKRREQEWEAKKQQAYRDAQKYWEEQRRRYGYI